MSRRATLAVTAGAGTLLLLVAALLLREEAAPTVERRRLEEEPTPSAGVDLPVPAPARGRAASAPRVPVAPHFPGFVVRQSDDSPLPGVRITLRPAPGQPGETLQAVTDADGNFDLAVAQPLPGATLVAEWTPVTRILGLGDEVEQVLRRGPVSATLVTTQLDYTSGVPRRIALATGWLLGGTVLDGAGRPLHGAQLLAETGNAASSGAQGEFLLRDIDPVAGHVQLVGTAPGHASSQVVVDAPPAAEPAAHTLLVLPEPGVLSGAVRFQNGVPAANVQLICLARDEVGPGPYGMQTGPDGSFRFENLPPGNFDFVIRVPDDETRAAASADAVAESWLPVAPFVGELPAQVIVLATGLSLRGFVRDAEGRPLPGHLVVARAARDVPCDPLAWSPAASCEVGTDGRFELRRLQPGSWRLCVEGLPQGCEHLDHFLWRALGSPGAGPALAEDGPRAGPPRPTELVRDVNLTPTSTPVQLEVKRPTDPTSNVAWPFVHASLPDGVYERDVQLELLRGEATLARSPMSFGWFFGYTPDASLAAGLLRFTRAGSLPILRELHDVQLEHEFGKLEFAPLPVLMVTVVDAHDGRYVEGVTLAVHWLGGGRPDAVVFSGGTRAQLPADRREARWALTVEAPGYRRHHAEGELHGSLRPGLPPLTLAAVSLQRW